MTKCFAYLRVSGRSQIDGHGFERQEECIREYAEKAGYEIANVYRDGAVSGTLDEADRPAFQELVTDMLKNGVRTVIVEGLDRLAREYRIQESLLIYLASKGITLISARTQENVTEAIQADPMRKALVQMQGVFAELEKSLLVKKLKKARDAKRQSTGKCEGRRSYSEANPEIVADIKRLRRRYKNKTVPTFAEIAAHLNEKGFRNQSGRPFTEGAVKMLYVRNK